MSNNFVETEPTLQNYWRSVIMFGKNSASYKFALAQALLHLSKRGNDFVTLDELAIPFSESLLRHVKSGNRQSLSASSKFLDACSKHADGHLTKDEVINKTVQLGFVNVINAFHIVNNREIQKRFFLDERSGTKKGIRLTENLYELQSSEVDLQPESEARWRLVETAWEHKLAVNLIDIKSDLDRCELFVNVSNRRIDVTSSRKALNGYQKGRCFYCFREISIDSGSPKLADVDHFFPHLLKREIDNVNIDGVWNLVLACRSCNGASGKSARIPSASLVERLNRRNEYLISSNHPLKETIIRQTGKTSKDRIGFIRDIHHQSLSALIHTWQPSPEDISAF